MLPNKRRSRRRTTLAGVAGLSVACAALLAACAPGAASSGTASSSKSASTSVGNGKVTITVEEASIDGPLFQKLASLFEAKYPNITVKVIGQDFNTLQTNVPRILAGCNVPDIIRLGAFGNTVTDKQLANLDPYAATYGWNNWPQSQFESTRSNANGNRARHRIAVRRRPRLRPDRGLLQQGPARARSGLSVPATLAALEADMAKAKAKRHPAHHH